MRNELGNVESVEFMPTTDEVGVEVVETILLLETLTRFFDEGMLLRWAVSPHPTKANMASPVMLSAVIVFRPFMSVVSSFYGSCNLDETSVPFDFHTLAIVFPYSLPIALVGTLETLMTAMVVDDSTNSKSDKNKEIRGQGIANIFTGFFGGMAGCAMIGQSTLNV